jgi:hypothetical protein
MKSRLSAVDAGGLPMTEDDALDELDQIHNILSEVKFPKDVAKRLLNHGQI